MPGEPITILEEAPALGGSLDAAGDSSRGYSMRGGRLFGIENDECNRDLFKSIALSMVSRTSVLILPIRPRSPGGIQLRDTMNFIE